MSGTEYAMRYATNYDLEVEMKSDDWPVKTEIDRKAMYYLLNYWIDEFGFTPEQVIDTIREDWPYFSILYTTDENEEYDISVDVDVKLRLARATAIDRETGEMYIHDERWNDDRAMLQDLELLDFDSWFAWAEDAIRYDRQFENDI